MRKTIELKAKRNWVRLEVLTEKLAAVLNGNVHRRGDILERPQRMTWADASQIDDRGNTVLSPLDLETIYDEVTDWRFRPESNGDPLPDLEDLEAQEAFREVDARIDQDGGMARDIHEALNDKGNPPSDLEEAA